MYNVEELDSLHKEITGIIYATHQIDKKFEAQTIYTYIIGMLQIAKGTPKPEFLNVGYVEEGHQLLLGAVERFSQLDTEFDKPRFVIKVERFMRIIQDKLSVLRVADFFKSFKIDSESQPGAVDMKNLQFVTVSTVNPQLSDFERSMFQKDLKETRNELTRWQNGWYTGESLKNTAMRHTLNLISDWAETNNQDELIELINSRNNLFKLQIPR